MASESYGCILQNRKHENIYFYVATPISVLNCCSLASLDWVQFIPKNGHIINLAVKVNNLIILLRLRANLVQHV